MYQYPFPNFLAQETPIIDVSGPLEEYVTSAGAEAALDFEDQDDC